MHLLSQLYQNLHPSHPPPSFYKHRFPTPSTESVRATLPLMPHFRQTYHLWELGPMYTKANHSIVRVEYRIERHQVEALRAKLRANMSSLSVQDCLTAYVVTLFNRCIDPPILNVTNAACVGVELLETGASSLFLWQYREVLTDPHVAGNAIYLAGSALASRDLYANIPADSVRAYQPRRLQKY
jgi:hypothetical protein